MPQPQVREVTLYAHIGEVRMEIQTANCTRLLADGWPGDPPPWIMAVNITCLLRLPEELGMQTYFADPYCSWQGGTNESTKGLTRRYFPKRTDFHLMSQGAVNEVVARLNSRPRKVLGYQTPLEVFTAHR